jgi:HEAT repeat protein
MLEADEAARAQDYKLASQAIIVMGSSIVPELTSILHDRQASVSERISDLLGEVGIRFGPPLKGQFKQYRAARALALIDPKGISCLTNLLMSADADIREWALYGLSLYPSVRSRPDIQRTLVHTAASDPDTAVRVNAIYRLSQLGQEAETKTVVPLGLRLIDSSNEEERMAAALLLTSLLHSGERRMAIQHGLNSSDATAVSDCLTELRSVYYGLSEDP